MEILCLIVNYLDEIKGILCIRIIRDVDVKFQGDRVNDSLGFVQVGYEWK